MFPIEVLIPYLLVKTFVQLVGLPPICFVVLMQIVSSQCLTAPSSITGWDRPVTISAPSYWLPLRLLSAGPVLLAFKYNWSLPSPRMGPFAARSMVERVPNPTLRHFGGDRQPNEPVNDLAWFGLRSLLPGLVLSRISELRARSTRLNKISNCRLT